MTHWIEPNWQVPAHVRAYTTTRTSGNLALHVGDDPHQVMANRARLTTSLGMPEAHWLTQVHGNHIVTLGQDHACQADGAYSNQTSTACVVMTADCLPVLLCDAQGTEVAALHCGWRGLSQGIIEKALLQMRDNANIIAWLGPAISAAHYEVDDQVREAFPEDKADTNCFQPNAAGRWQANLYELATRQLNRAGVTQIAGGDYCTYQDEAAFFSYRRETKTGRMATVIWLT